METAARPQTSKIIERKSKKKSFMRIMIPAGIITLLAVVFLILRPLFLKQTEISDPIPIAVINFENQTGDKSFDYLQKAIPNLLITSLEQSNYFHVTTWQRMFDLLKQIGHDSIETIDEELGFELCRMEGIATIVLGSFIKAGEQFATDVKVLDVASKRLLKSASSQGEGVGSILQNQIDELSRDIAQGVGLSERKIAITQKLVAEVTTNSMEAYQHYIMGITELGHSNHEDAKVSLEKAVQLDSTFAIAQWYLGLANNFLRDEKGAQEAFEKAKALSYKAPNKERLLIDAYYIWGIEKNREQALRILRQMVKKYPKEKFPHLWLGFDYKAKELYSEAIAEFNKTLELDPQFGWAYEQLTFTYVRMCDFEKAIDNLKRYASAAPGNANSFDRLGDLYFQIGHFDDAIINYQEALKIKPEFRSNWKIAYIYAMKEDYAEAMKWINNYINRARSTGPLGEGLWWKAFYHSWLGKIDLSLSELYRLEDLAEKVENFDAIDWVNWTLGWIYLESGDYNSSRKAFTKMYELRLRYGSWIFSHKIGYNYFTGLIDLNEGKIDSVKMKLTEIKSLLPKAQLEVSGQFYNNSILSDYNILSTELLLSHGSLEEAMHLWNKTTIPTPQMDLGDLGSYNVPFLKDYSARIYVKMGNIDKAIAEYEQLITFDPDSKERLLIHPKYHYRLAKLYEEKGATQKAITEYEKFLDIWKDADKDLPELIDAKARYSKLSEK